MENKLLTKTLQMETIENKSSDSFFKQAIDAKSADERAFHLAQLIIEFTIKEMAMRKKTCSVSMMKEFNANMREIEIYYEDQIKTLIYILSTEKHCNACDINDYWHETQTHTTTKNEINVMIFNKLNLIVSGKE